MPSLPGIAMDVVPHAEESNEKPELQSNLDGILSPNLDDDKNLDVDKILSEGKCLVILTLYL